MTEYPTRTRWLILALLYCIMVIMVIDRLNIAIAAKYIMPEYGLSEVQMGWIFSAFLLSYSILHVPGGWLGDRFGPRRVLAFAICWWSVFTAATAVAGDLFLTSLIGVMGAFIIVRVLIGIGESVGLPNHTRAVANWFPPGERGRALGIIQGGNSLGAALTPPLIAWIMVTFGWRAAFYLAGGVGILLVLGWYWLFTDRPEEHPRINSAELRHIKQAAASTPAQNQAPGPVPWQAILSSADVWYLAVISFVSGYIIYIYFSWFYLYLVNVRGFSVLGGGVYSAAPFLANTVAAPMGGWLSDHLSQRFGKRIGRCGPGFVGLLLTAGFIFAGAASPDPYLAILFLSLGVCSLTFNSTCCLTATLDLSRTYAGTVSGFMHTAIHVGGAISPTLTPFLAQRLGWESAFYVAAALALLGTFFWLGVHPEQTVELREEAFALSQKEVVVSVGSGG